MLRTLPTLVLVMMPTITLISCLELWARHQVGTVSVRDGLAFDHVPESNEFCYEPDPEYGHRPRPNTCGFNDYGFVATGSGDRSSPPRRVMILGDNTRGLLLGSGDLGLELVANPRWAGWRSGKGWCPPTTYVIWWGR